MDVDALPVKDGFRLRGEAVTRTETFVDAAFAFALSLLAIAGQEIPGSVAELELALKGLPAFAASFLVLVQFWSGHAEWSRRYGLDDTASRRLSLLLVFLALVFVYPLRMVFGSLFSALSSGWLPARFTIEAWSQVPVLFLAFAAAMGAMAATMVALYHHAWRQRGALRLDAGECAATARERRHWAVMLAVSGLSIALALAIPAEPRFGAWIGLPGFVFFLIQPLQWGCDRVASARGAGR